MRFVRKLLGRKTEEADEVSAKLPRQEAQSKVAPRGAAATAPLAEAESVTYFGEFRLAGDDVESLGDLQMRQHTPYRANHGLDEVTTPGIRLNRRSPSQTRGLRVGYISDVGQIRDHNEDTVIAIQGTHLGDDASDPFGFFVVTDGMGGHRAGEIASSLAARLVCRDVLEKIYLPFLLNQTSGPNMAPLTEILRDAIQNANDQVYEQVPGGGTTLTCALILGRRAYIAHVGDSRAYLLTSHDIRQVTQDHSYVGRLIELGELSREEAAVHPQRHVLYRAIGQGEHLDIDTYHQSLPPGSRLLLCSDGLSGSVSEKEIGRIIASAETPEEACQRLLQAANDAGGPDNITAVIIEAPPD